jgi:O-antigen ligase
MRFPKLSYIFGWKPLWLVLLFISVFGNTVLTPRIFLSSFDVSDQESGGIAWYFRQLFTMLTIIYPFLLLIMYRRDFIISKMPLYIIVFFAIPIVFSTWLSITHEFYPQLLLGLSLGVYFMILDAKDWSWWVTTCYFITFLYLFGSIAAAALYPNWSLEYNYSQTLLFPIRFHGIASLTNHLAPFLAVSPVFYYLYCKLEGAKNTNRKVFVYFIISFISLLFTQSKTVIILLITGTLLMYFYTIFKTRVSRFAIILPLILIAYLSLIFFGDSSIPQDDRLSTLTGRTEIWSYVLSLAKDNTFFGYGNSLWRDETRYYFFISENWAPGQSHNQWVQTFGRSGFIGLMALIGVVLCGFKLSLNSTKATYMTSILLYTILFGRTFSESPFEPSLFSDSFLFFAIVIGTIIISYKKDKI